MDRTRRRFVPDNDGIASRRLAVVVIAHVDTGPLWYQWMARAGHDAWLWYGHDAPAGAVRLIRETSPDVLLVHATSIDDPGWTQVQAIRQSFPYARLPVVAVGDDLPSATEPDVFVLPDATSAAALLDAVNAATHCAGRQRERP
jgi:hypothetical protein